MYHLQFCLAVNGILLEMMLHLYLSGDDGSSPITIDGKWHIISTLFGEMMYHLNFLIAPWSQSHRRLRSILPWWDGRCFSTIDNADGLVIELETWIGWTLHLLFERGFENSFCRNLSFILKKLGPSGSLNIKDDLLYHSWVHRVLFSYAMIPCLVWARLKGLQVLGTECASFGGVRLHAYVWALHSCLTWLTWLRVPFLVFTLLTDLLYSIFCSCLPGLGQNVVSGFHSELWNISFVFVPFLPLSLDRSGLLEKWLDGVHVLVSSWFNAWLCVLLNLCLGLLEVLRSLNSCFTEWVVYWGFQDLSLKEGFEIWIRMALDQRLIAGWKSWFYTKCPFLEEDYGYVQDSHVLEKDYGFLESTFK